MLLISFILQFHPLRSVTGFPRSHHIWRVTRKFPNCFLFFLKLFSWHCFLYRKVMAVTRWFVPNVIPISAGDVWVSWTRPIHTDISTHQDHHVSTYFFKEWTRMMMTMNGKLIFFDWIYFISCLVPLSNKQSNAQQVSL